MSPTNIHHLSPQSNSDEQETAQEALSPLERFQWAAKQVAEIEKQTSSSSRRAQVSSLDKLKNPKTNLASGWLKRNQDEASASAAQNVQSIQKMPNRSPDSFQPQPNEHVPSTPSGKGK